MLLDTDLKMPGDGCVWIEYQNVLIRQMRIV